MNDNTFTIATLIAQIEAATEQNTVSNQMVARVLQYLYDHGITISGIKPCASVQDLPQTQTPHAYIVSGHIYVWVGSGGDTLSGLYQDCGPVQGPKGDNGDKGDKGDNGISIGDNFTTFSALPSLEGKTTDQKEAMVPDGNMVDALANIYTTLTGTSFTNRIINSSGASVQPSSGNGNRLVVVFDVSQLVGQKIDFSSFNNYANAYSWSVWKGNTKVSSTGLSQNTDVRVMSDATSDSGSFSGSVTILEGDKYLALVCYSNKSFSATASLSVKEVVLKNEEDIKQNKEDIAGINTFTRSYNPVATYANRIIDSSGASVQPSSGNGNRLVVVFDVSQLVGQKIDFSSFNNYANAYSWSVLKDGTTWSVTGLTQHTDTRLVSGTTSAAGRYTDSVVVQPGDKWLALVNYSNNAVSAENIVTPLGGKIRELDGLANPEGVKEYNPANSFALKVKNLAHGAGVKPLVLAHFSDIHGNGNALSRMLAWCAHYGNFIDDILHTGDTVESMFSDGMSFWNGAGAESVLNIIGNHDASTSSDGNGGKTQAECYDQFIAPYADGWGIVQPTNVDDSSSEEYKACYWYKDYAEKNVRLIALDCMVKATGTSAQVAAQLSWLENVLIDASDNGLTVVIAYHSHPLSSGYAKVVCPFSHMTAGGVGAYNWPAAAQLVTDFVNNELPGQTTVGKFACWLCGHQHKDVVVWYDTYGQLSIAIDSMALSVAARDISGKGQDCFNLVGIDTANHIVKLLRVGNDVDAQMRKIDQCAIDYTTGKVLHEPEMPSVPAWSLQPDKPAYTPQEIGAIPATTDITDIVKISQADYDALQTKSPTTLYVIVS